MVDKRTVSITELPVGRWTEDYKAILEGIPGVKDYEEHIIWSLTLSLTLTLTLTPM